MRVYQFTESERDALMNELELIKDRSQKAVIMLDGEPLVTEQLQYVYNEIHRAFVYRVVRFFQA